MSQIPAPAARAVTADQVTDAVLAGAWVVDVRHRDSPAAARPPAPLDVERADGRAATVGWFVPCDDDIVLLTDDPERLESALRELARRGFDAQRTHVHDTSAPLAPSYRRADWSDYVSAVTAGDPLVLIDVREADDWHASHLPGALHVPLHHVEHRAAALPRGPLWVHCRSGYRAGIAASLLHRAGRDVVHIDDLWERFPGPHAVAAVTTAA